MKTNCFYRVALIFFVSSVVSAAQTPEGLVCSSQIVSMQSPNEMPRFVPETCLSGPAQTVLNQVDFDDVRFTVLYKFNFYERSYPDDGINEVVNDFWICPVGPSACLTRSQLFSDFSERTSSLNWMKYKIETTCRPVPKCPQRRQIKGPWTE